MHKMKNNGTKKLTKLPVPFRVVRREVAVEVFRRVRGLVAAVVFFAGVCLRVAINYLLLKFSKISSERRVTVPAPSVITRSFSRKFSMTFSAAKSMSPIY